MIYLIDTDTLIHLIRGVRLTKIRTDAQQARAVQARKVIARCRKLQARGDELAISSITAAELEFGARNSGQYETESLAVQKVLTPFMVHPFDANSCPVAYGIVRHELESQGTPIGAMDLLIGAHAIALGAILVTGNRSHFSRIPGLKTEHWLP